VSHSDIYKFKGLTMRKMKEIDLNEVREYIGFHPDAKIYFGCDSTKFRKNGEWNARYVTAIVVYEKDNNKIFGEVSYERDFDQNPSRPFNRMFTEVQKTVNIIESLKNEIENRDYEIHIDVNKSNEHGSNVAYNAVKGLVLSVCGKEPKFKPDAFAASCVADHFVNKK